jgi:predicted nucleic acid-binding protein
VALVYFDSSALVKLVVEEAGTELVAALWDGCDAALSSRLAYPEVRAAVAAAARNHDVTPSGAAHALRLWDDYWKAVRPVELTGDVEQRAGRLTGSHALRGADAVHLASALAIETSDLILAAWNRRLHMAARAEGLVVAPDDLDR